VNEYAARLSEWLTDNHGNRYRGVTPAPMPAPDRAFYEDQYRNARHNLRQPRLRKSLRKYWQHQLWGARACLKSYFGADPPPEDGG
jgi:hypothetical protein